MSDSITLEDISPYLVLGQADDGGQPIVETARALHDFDCHISATGTLLGPHGGG